MMGKQIYGDGSLFQRKDGRWCYKVRIGESENGSPRYKCFYSKDKTGRKAKAAYIDWLTHQEEDVIERRQKVSSWAETWLETYKEGKSSTGNCRNYRGYVENHIVPRIGDMWVDQVREVDIEKLYRDEAELSGSALNYIRICLNGIFDSAVANHLCKENPAAKAKPPKKINPPPVYYSEEEVGAIVQAAQTMQEGVYPLALLYTGCRIGELCGLMWCDFTGESLMVRRTISKCEEGCAYHVKDIPKTDRQREVVLNDEGAEFFSSLPKTGLYIFTGPHGGFLSPDRYRIRYYQAIDAMIAAGLDIRRLSPHKCRHTYGTILLRTCRNIRTVQDQLGHARIGTTELYTHTDAEARLKDVGLLQLGKVL